VTQTHAVYYTRVFLMNSTNIADDVQRRPSARPSIANPRRQLLAALGLAVATFLLYFHRLDGVPPYLAHDEVIYSLNAYTIATTGHDVNGRLLPLLFQVTAGYWATPVSIYTTALFLKILPLTETVVRTPNVIIGAVDVALVYLLTLRISRSQGQALVAAVLLALTPAHMIHSRMAGDLIYPVPFLLASLLGLVAYFEDRDYRVLLLATTIMGVGCYTYLGAAALMPLYFLVICWIIVAFDARPVRTLLVATAGFVLPLILLVPWLMQHPEQFGNQVQSYGLYDSARLNPLAGLLELLSYPSLTKRAVLYYQFFNPSFLFLGGDSSLMNSTRAAGVLLTPLAVFLPIGINYVVNRGRTPGYLLVLAGFVLAPVAALLVLEVKVRALVLLPLVAMIGACGAYVMFRAKRKVWSVVAIALLAAAPYEFVPFYRDYMTRYRLRSAFWFESNRRGALEEVIARDHPRPIPQIYISRTPRWIDWYWKWYLAKAGRPELFARTIFNVPGELDPATMPAHSVVLGEVEEVEAAPVFRTGAQRVAQIPEVDGTVSFIVFER
jgi:4-amino-4-deoxy-L-arabinose transferase-like glycosyltransferase